LPKNSRINPQQIKDTEDRVKEDRRFQIEASIVRIMKERRTLSHVDLTGELVKKVNFPLDMTLVKQRIESLIEKDYIKRNANDASIYEYIA
jgi:Cullin protein neddylation domain